MAVKTFLYYTTQSNIAIGVVCLVFGILDVLSYLGKKVQIPRWLNVVKFATTVAITLTFIVFWTMLVPVQLKDSLDYLLSVDNILCHTLVPIFAVVDWLLNSQKYVDKKHDFLWSVSTPLAYFVFAMVVASYNVDFGYGARVPYFFLDFYQYGWFNISTFPFGVFWWILIVLCLVLGIGALLMQAKKLCNKKREK